MNMNMNINMNQSGGYVEKQMVRLQYLTAFYSSHSNQYQCNTPQAMITEGLL
jgi:hypothetical protein